VLNGNSSPCVLKLTDFSSSVFHEVSPFALNEGYATVGKKLKM
jgi:hypothetical protein